MDPKMHRNFVFQASALLNEIVIQKTFIYLWQIISEHKIPEPQEASSYSINPSRSSAGDLGGDRDTEKMEMSPLLTQPSPQVSETPLVWQK